MKNVICCLALICCLWNCKPSADTNSQNAFAAAQPLPDSVSVAVLQQLFCPIDFGDAESDIVNNRGYIFAQHFSPNINDMPTQTDWRRQDSLYRTIQFDTMPEDKRKLLQQVAAITILRNHALLTQTIEKERIAYYTKIYVESGGKSAGLLYYCLGILGNTLDATQQQAYINAVTPRATATVEEFKKWLEDTKANIQGQTFPPEVVAYLKTDFAKVEQIIKDEQAFVQQLKAI